MIPVSIIKTAAKFALAGIGVLAAKAILMDEVDCKLASFGEAMLEKIDSILPEVY